MIYATYKAAQAIAAILNSQPGYAKARVYIVPGGWTVIRSYAHPYARLTLAD